MYNVNPCVFWSGLPPRPILPVGMGVRNGQETSAAWWVILAVASPANSGAATMAQCVGIRNCRRLRHLVGDPCVASPAPSVAAALGTERVQRRSAMVAG